MSLKSDVEDIIVIDPDARVELLLDEKDLVGFPYDIASSPCLAVPFGVVVFSMSSLLANFSVCSPRSHFLRSCDSSSLVGSNSGFFFVTDSGISQTW